MPRRSPPPPYGLYLTVAAGMGHLASLYEMKRVHVRELQKSAQVGSGDKNDTEGRAAPDAVGDDVDRAEPKNLAPEPSLVAAPLDDAKDNNTKRNNAAPVFVDDTQDNTDWFDALDGPEAVHAVPLSADDKGSAPSFPSEDDEDD